MEHRVVDLATHEAVHHVEVELQPVGGELHSALEAAVGLTPSLGLGLTIAQRLAEAMSGHLSYQHNGSLTRFELRLPL